MERLAQYLDDLEDLCYAVALRMERIRMVLRFTAFVTAFACFLFFGIHLALVQPPLGLAVVSILIVAFLYFGATGRFQRQPPIA